MNEILRIKDLSVSYQSKDSQIFALKNISLSLKAGKVLGVVGESGCGKSTLALSIARLLPDNARILSGEIIFLEENILKASEKRLQEVRGKKIGYIFQDPTAALNPVISIGAQLVETITSCRSISRQEAKREASRLLELVNIPNPEEYLKFYPHQLSGGLNQRVMIALALSLGPELLIADEPTSNLDVTIGASILGLLINLKQKLNLTIIFITHDLSLVNFLADEVAVMYKGEIVECQETRRIFSAPDASYTKELLNSSINTTLL